MEILTAAGWKINAKIGRCRSCTDNKGCKINNFIAALEALDVQPGTNLDSIAADSGLGEPTYFGSGTTTGIEQHVVYSCNGGQTEPDIYHRGTINLTLGTEPQD